MSAGNACAQIGIANTNKIPMIAGYDQGNDPWYGAEGPFIGVNANVQYSYNALGEAVGFTCPSAEAAATGKTAQWVWNDATPIAAGTTRVNIAAGVATANASGTHNVYGVPAAGIPAGSYFWAFER